MGTDIFIYSERLVDGAWQPLPEPRIEKKGKAIPVQAIDLERPYGLFSLLGGGGVGLRSSLVEQEPIFAPRGFPDDMNPLYRKRFKSWYSPHGSDGGASWLRLSELTELDWDQRLRHHAYVLERFTALFDPDKPFPALFPKKEQKLYHGLFTPPPEGTCKVKWSISLREYVGCSEWFLEQLTALAAGEEMRIIYWFSS